MVDSGQVVFIEIFYIIICVDKYLFFSAKTNKVKKKSKTRQQERKSKKLKEVKLWEAGIQTNSKYHNLDADWTAGDWLTTDTPLLGEKEHIDMGITRDKNTLLQNHKRQREPEVIVFDDPAKQPKVNFNNVQVYITYTVTQFTLHTCIHVHN